MRPVLLELAGFASFREPTTVDFREAEYFALIGPTGSGKSTVIDAITFALYGSVSRWDDRRAVAMALAPTVGRGTVRFVFDIGRAGAGAAGRYVVARELRRAPSGGVTVRSARLERLRDAMGTGSAEEETEPLADGAPATTRAVEELLGLPFGDFTTCVVLPQGAFAEFLHTEPRRRQETLVRLLGLGVYDTIAKEANAEAKRQEQRAQVLTERLVGYAHATAEAEQVASDRVAELAELRDRVDTAMPALSAASAERAAAETRVRQLDADVSGLAGLDPPAGLAALAARRRAARAAMRSAAIEVAKAESADTAAREALDAAPVRGPLEQAQRLYAELAEITAALPGFRARRAAAVDVEAAAQLATATAQRAAEAARVAREHAAGVLTRADDAARQLATERDALRAVVRPEGLDELAGSWAKTVAAHTHAIARLADAERTDAAARSALASAPDRAPLEQARRDHGHLADARADRAAAATAQEAAEGALTRAREHVADARADLDQVRERYAASQRRDLAAALRPALVVGDRCPVCAQRVAALPPPPPTGDLGAAAGELAAAEARYEDARRAETAAATDWARAVAEVEGARAAVARWVQALASVAEAIADIAPDRVAAIPSGGGDESDPARSLRRANTSSRRDVLVSAALPPGPHVSPVAAIEAALTELDRLVRLADHADQAVRAARAERDEAAAVAKAAREQLTAAATALRAARDPLVPLGAPAVDYLDDIVGTDVVAGWGLLVDWARGEVAARDAIWPATRAAVDDARAVHAQVERGLAAAERNAQERRQGEIDATRAEQAARSEVERAERREHELRAALRDSPTADEVAGALDRIMTLEAAVRRADGTLRSARAVLRDAEQSAADVERDVGASWDALRAARDPLVPLGAPPPGAADVDVAWAALTTWARAEAARRADQLTAARAARDAAAATCVAIQRRIHDDLGAHAVDVPAREPRRLGAAVGSSRDESQAASARQAFVPAGHQRPDVAAKPAEVDPVATPAVVATALERARGAFDRIVERRAEAAALRAERDAAEEARQVARMLGTLLRSDGFPRWLVASALDALVADASTTLAELSGGQFELTHENGEFLVVDHADTDARRPVKTLSGGETFQASLALALALSAQLSGLAANGAARLESIFLDEGFGTLDEANLETVASTLEALASRGDRVVGVITHVAALAERVPVRFAVQRDQRTSSVVRESL